MWETALGYARARQASLPAGSWSSANLGSWFPCTRVAPARSPRRMTWGLPTCQPPLLGSMCLCSMGIPHMSQAGEQRGTGLDLRLRSTSNPKGSGSYTSEASGFPGKEMRQKRRLPAQSPLGVACPHEEDPPQVEKRGRPPVLPTSNSSHLLVRPSPSLPQRPGREAFFLFPPCLPFPWPPRVGPLMALPALRFSPEALAQLTSSSGITCHPSNHKPD